MAKLQRRVRAELLSADAWVDDDVVLTNHVGDDMIARALRDHNTSVMVTLRRVQQASHSTPAS